MLARSSTIALAIGEACVIAYLVFRLRSERQRNSSTEQKDETEGLPLRSLADYERSANRLLPGMARRYFSFHAGSGATIRACRDHFDALRLRPRILRGAVAVDTSTTLFGVKCSMPVAVAPSAFHRLAHASGERGTAGGCCTAGIPYSFNWFLSQTPAQRIVEETVGPKWLHLYIYRERHLVLAALRAAEETGAFSAVIVTCDHPHNRVKEAVTPDFERHMPGLLEGQRSARHALGFEDGSFLPNVADAVARASKPGVAEASYWNGSDVNNDESLCWDDVAWLRSETSLPLIVKGVLCAEDAVLARDAGAAAVVVSNHGGRQLDGAVPAIEALPEVVEAVGDDMTVLLDSGVRTGGDVIKALALGAKGVLIGRPALWGLAHGGESGLAEMLEVLRKDLEADMRSIGCASVDEIGRSSVL